MSRQQNDGLRKRCTCPRRTWAKCRHPWHFDFKWDGERYRFSLSHHVRRVRRADDGTWERDRSTLGDPITDKTTAADERDRLRTAIREGTLQEQLPSPRQELTLRQLADVYLERYVAVERASTADDFRHGLRVICQTTLPVPTGGVLAFGAWRLADIVTDTVERYREARRASGAGLGGTNRSLSRLRALLNWAVRVGYLEQTPFKRSTVTVVKLSREAPRSRRLDQDTDEETRLLGACRPHLRAIVECALETGMRQGEIMSLQWSQVEGLKLERAKDAPAWLIVWAPRPEIVLPWTKTKTRRDRRIPISTRLRAMLELRRFDPAGDPLQPTAYVFGNEVGEQVASPKRAWLTAVLKAHGYTLKLTRTCNLTAETRAALDAIDLHFHDLRREAGSRWLEGGVPLHVVRDWLGHTSIAQTSTYLAGTMRTQHDAMTQFEARRAGQRENLPLGETKAPVNFVTQCDTDSGTGAQTSALGAMTVNKIPKENTRTH